MYILPSTEAYGFDFRCETTLYALGCCLREHLHCFTSKVPLMLGFSFFFFFLFYFGLHSFSYNLLVTLNLFLQIAMYMN